MSIEEKKENDNEQTEVIIENKFTAFMKNNKAASFLGVLLFIVIALFYIKLQIEAAFKEEKNQLIEAFKGKIDSLKVHHIKIATEVFSWSVRNEMLGENARNLNELFLVKQYVQASFNL